MKRVVKFTGVLEYDPDSTTRDPEWCVDVALTNGDKHAGYFLYHTGPITSEDVEGTAGE
ncbi:hypothetical protein PV332_10645 [Streptomyces scabiei]|uniref:hypothetical protein n=1 Tax=Streptomyces scabiei TaxID=1930 RepID=UPI0029BCE593|nr:hypothetical protein [Streptomyces scabiei]MDX2575939.1 hypothetical protein [Streptomyces scabiei]MDX2794046.1 hypothetical protein [Streptomyces scabiei]MDX2885588.1 hypothetical protein [Streptomyces scabiei]MDX2993459.1 hypothetical protein [Streptomyces scabiei]MDX3028427.1 hypothetical protein [Streptomyces scabiei]